MLSRPAARKEEGGVLNRLTLPALDRAPVGENDVTLSECARFEPIFVLRDEIEIVSIGAWDPDVLIDEMLDFLATERGSLNILDAPDFMDAELDESLKSLPTEGGRLPVVRLKMLATPDDSEVLEGDWVSST